ncbi:MAG: SPOR domain-containing protein [Hymenobacteraceae bacterium]|nr:SPOR domain-containing protein [Hymenobacteraceae bacterium]MDX5395402.1 SPOR domain-containing protein [Hymenobacteraceae bacterium]MDX5511451.1 SPOR domain-containing protein [Hymenobacteraceae bacterium]
MVEKHIRTLLHEHDCVIIPEFGGLITRYAPARIHPVKHTFSPPSKRIAFNEKLRMNDGVLISTIAYEHKISQEQAQQQVSDFVLSLRKSLNEQNRYELQGIGNFKLNAERKIVFEYSEQENFLSDSFGLPELVARPIQVADVLELRTRKKVQEQLSETPKSGNRRFQRFMRKYSGAAASVLIGGLTMSAVYLFSLQADYDLSSLNPISINEHLRGISDNSPKTGALPELTESEKAAMYAAILPAANSADETAFEYESTAEAKLQLTEKEEVETKFESNDLNKTTLASDAEPHVEPVVVKADAKAALAETKPEKKAAKPVKADAIKKKAGRYYIIANAFSNLENAEKRMNEILEDGYNAKIIMPQSGNKLHRVSIADFSTEEEAQEQARELRKKYGQSIWVLNF